MIREIEGVVGQVGFDRAVLNVGGVGFLVLMPAPTLAALPAPGGRVKVQTYLSVREDSLTLFGFLKAADLELFEALLKVPSVGPKLALKVMNAPAVDLRRAISAGDAKLLPPIKGVGPKIREAIVQTLKDSVISAEPGSGGTYDQSDAALRALLQLGYRQAEARIALRAVPREVTDTAEKVRAALQLL